MNFPENSRKIQIAKKRREDQKNFLKSWRRQKKFRGKNQRSTLLFVVKSPVSLPQLLKVPRKFLEVNFSLPTSDTEYLVWDGI
jgi:hypothetical protein